MANEEDYVITKTGRRMPKRCLANLKPQRSDEPGRNPKGRPKRGLTISEALRGILESKDPKDGKRIADKVAKVIIDEALKGDHQMMQILLDRVEGKVVQPISGGGEVTIRLIYDDA